MNIYPSLVFFMTKENQHHLIQCPGPPSIFLRRCIAFGLASKGKEKDIMRKRKYKNKKEERYLSINWG